jgi:hypothetical protein
MAWCAADGDEALALIREYHQKSVRERGSVKEVVVGSSESVLRREP